MMNFGELLRKCRKDKGWSRHQMELRSGGMLTADTIKSLEYGVNSFPRNGTRAAIIKLFPELATYTKESTGFRDKYQSIAV